MQRNLCIVNIICVSILFIDFSLMRFKYACEEIYLTTSSRRKICRFVEDALTKSFKEVLLARLKTKS